MEPIIQADFEALSKDAKTWDGVGDTLGTASTDLTALQLTRDAFSFAGFDIAEHYRTIHLRVEKLLADGSTTAHGCATALRAVRSDFERFEDVTKADLYSLWQPVTH